MLTQPPLETNHPLLREGSSPFAPDVERLMMEFFDADMKGAQVSAKFRLYYHLRHFIPIVLRQGLQRLRNRGIDVPPDWYLPKKFFQRLDELAAAPNNLELWPDGASYALVLTHDVETEEGMRILPEIADIEEQLGFRSSWNLVPYKYSIDKGLLRDLTARRFEIGVHGYNHDGKLFFSEAIFRRRAKAINEAIQEYDSVGFRAPMVHRNAEWLQLLDIEYDASFFDVDPFQPCPGGVGAIWPQVVGKLVELPYTMPQDHTLFITLGHRDTSVWEQKLEFIRQRQGMALMVTHPDYLDTPERRGLYREFLRYARASGGFWSALPREAARWWRRLLGR